MVGGRCPPLASSAAPRRMCCLVLSAFIASAGAFTAPNCLAPALSARKGGSFAARGPALSPAGALSRPAPSTLAPTLPLARQSRSELTAPRLGMETVFQIDNYLTLPFWAMMIFAPKARITRSIMNGWLPFVPLIFVYSEQHIPIINPTLPSVPRYPPPDSLFLSPPSPFAPPPDPRDNVSATSLSSRSVQFFLAMPKIRRHPTPLHAVRLT
jgi:hypothetical protein